MKSNLIAKGTCNHLYLKHLKTDKKKRKHLSRSYDYTASDNAYILLPTVKLLSVLPKGRHVYFVFLNLHCNC